MPRPLRVHEPGSLWHLLSRGVQGSPIFDGDADCERFESKLGEYCAATDHRVYAYALLPDRFHLLVRAGESPLSSLMHPLVSAHAHYLNARRGTAGHVFQDRYRSTEIDRERYLLEVIRYLHLAPVRAGLVESPDEYRWTSHREYLRGEGPEWLLVGEAFALFGEDAGQALEAYQRFMQEGLKEGASEDLEVLLGWSARGRPVDASLAARAQAAVADIAAGVGAEAGEIGSGRRGPLLRQARALAAHYLTERLGIRAGEAAKILGRPRTSLYKEIAEGRRLAASARFASLLGSLEEDREEGGEEGAEKGQ